MPDSGVLQAGVTVADIEHEDESVISLELGAKVTLADGTATLDINSGEIPFLRSASPLIQDWG